MDEWDSCRDDPCTCVWEVDERDILAASRKVGELFFGPDDGTKSRDDVARRIGDVIRASFSELGEMLWLHYGTKNTRPS